MTFIRAVPGPSSLSLRIAVRSFSHSATAAAPPRSAMPDSEDDDLKTSSSEYRSSTRFGPAIDAITAYQWLKTEGQRFERATANAKAAWLGGSVPYQSNPSFRPPPPLSNRAQDEIWKALKQGVKTEGQIAEDFQVSKARIKAVQRLKAVEAELRRQNLPLQTAFLAGMEPLLGVSTSKRLSREVDMPHQSSAIEGDEEDRVNAGIGSHGAFEIRTGNVGSQSPERIAFEFRDEEAIIAERSAEAEARAAEDVSNEAEAKVAEQAAAPDTPEQSSMPKREEKPAKDVGTSRVVPSGRGLNWRFVNMPTAEPKKLRRKSK